MDKQFNLKGDYIELIKILKASGLCESGGEAKNVVGLGLVKVDGLVEYRKKCKIRQGQMVEYGDSQIIVN